MFHNNHKTLWGVVPSLGKIYLLPIGESLPGWILVSHGNDRMEEYYRRRQRNNGIPRIKDSMLPRVRQKLHPHPKYSPMPFR